MLYIHEDSPRTPAAIDDLLDTLRYHFVFSIETLSMHVSEVIHRTLAMEDVSEETHKQLQMRIALSTLEYLPSMIEAWTLQYYRVAYTQATHVETTLLFSRTARTFGNIIARYALANYAKEILMPLPEAPDLDQCIHFAITDTQIDAKAQAFFAKKNIPVCAVTPFNIRYN